MSQEQFIKNIEFSKALALADLVSYEEGRVESRTISQTESVTITLFAFWKGEGLSSHSAPGDALVHVLDGTGLITIGDTKVNVAAGEVVVMPSDIPHAVDAEENFKMLITLVKG
jgi:quercetin dioxygenase-like cupin family protein